MLKQIFLSPPPDLNLLLSSIRYFILNILIIDNKTFRKLFYFFFIFSFFFVSYSVAKNETFLLLKNEALEIGKQLVAVSL